MVYICKTGQTNIIKNYRKTNRNLYTQIPIFLSTEENRQLNHSKAQQTARLKITGGNVHQPNGNHGTIVKPTPSALGYPEKGKTGSVYSTLVGLNIIKTTSE